jgi:hypothetical protein
MAKNKPDLHQPIPELEAALAMPIRFGTTARAVKNQNTRFSYSKAFFKALPHRKSKRPHDMGTDKGSCRLHALAARRANGN